MQYFYSPSTAGFYVDSVHSTMPDDVFPISEQLHEDLLAGQAAGKVITLLGVANVGLTDPVVPEKTWDDIRDKRDELLTQSDWTQTSDNALSEDMKEEWRVYRKTLRDIPSTFAKPSLVVWPAIPGEV